MKIRLSAADLLILKWLIIDKITAMILNNGAKETYFFFSENIMHMKHEMQM